MKKTTGYKKYIYLFIIIYYCNNVEQSDDTVLFKYSM